MTLAQQTLAQQVCEAGLDSQTEKRILLALVSDDVAVRVTRYHDGFVPTSYRYAAEGSCTVTEITTTGSTSTPSRYDRKRSNGKGALVQITVAKAGQRRGRYI
jgi:hypothetical protein